MYFPIWIAQKYCLTKSKKNLIHRMNIVTCLSIGLSTMALIIVLSIFNGLEGVIKDLFRSFDPAIKIELKQGKYFELPNATKQQLNSIPGISQVIEVVEENVLLNYQGRQLVAKIKGVTDNFVQESPLEKAIIQGKLVLRKGQQNLALIGMGIQYKLGIYLGNALDPIQVYYPKQLKQGKTVPQHVYSKKSIMPGAVFAIEKHFDDHYVITPLSFVTTLIGLANQRTALEIQTQTGFKLGPIKKQIKAYLPDGFHVRDQDEQHDTLMRAIRIERLFVLTTLSFILLVASLNIFFILSMLVLDKKKDVAILYTLGATKNHIRVIFLCKGLWISLTGALLGMLIAYLLTWLQERFGWISLGMQTGIIEAYPIKRQLSDFIYTAITIVGITLLATLKPAQLATKNTIKPYL